MKVKAAAGLRVPHEKRVHEYITDAEVQEVEDTLYYRRLVADGDLVKIDEKAHKNLKPMKGADNE